MGYVWGGQLEIGQPAVKCVLSPLWPTVAAFALCLSAPAVPSAWDGHPVLRLGIVLPASVFSGRRLRLLGSGTK